MMKRVDKNSFVAGFAICLLLIAPVLAQDTRNIQPLATDTTVPKPLSKHTVELGRYYALVIGIDHYRAKSWTLRTPVNDAQAISEVLKRNYNFEVQTLPEKEATHDGILKAIYSYQDRLKPNDNLMIYYAGHGYLDQTTGKAYWIPSDADSYSNENRIISDDLTAAIKDQNALHVLIISDSCFSGAMNYSEGAPSESGNRMLLIRNMLSKRSRTLMASGGSEPVVDGGGDKNHSVFASAVIRSLEKPDHPIFTASDLFFGSVRRKVGSKFPQLPQYASIRNSNDDQGDFVFLKRGAQLESFGDHDGISVPPPKPQDADMQQIRDLINRYAQAVNDRDTKQLKLIWPTALDKDLDRVRSLPKRVRINLTVDSASLLDTDQNAIILCSQTIQDDIGTSQDHVTLVVGKYSGAWIIDRIPPSD